MNRIKTASLSERAYFYFVLLNFRAFVVETEEILHTG